MSKFFLEEDLNVGTTGIVDVRLELTDFLMC